MNALPKQLDLLESQACRNGHIGDRYVKPDGTSTCRECRRLSDQKRFPQKAKAQSRRRRLVAVKPPPPPPVLVVPAEPEGVDFDDGTRLSLADWKARFPQTWARISLASTDSEAWGSTWERDE